MQSLILCYDRWKELFGSTNDMQTYENIRKITTGQENNYTTGCFLDYNYFKTHHKMKVKDLVIDLSEQKATDADPKAK